MATGVLQPTEGCTHGTAALTVLCERASTGRQTSCRLPRKVRAPLIQRYCVFCEIVARRAPATVLYESDAVIAICNVLGWVPVMLLVLPKHHLTQAELWEDIGEVGRVAASLGREHCPAGFRLLSNFGRDGMQSQDHAHVHVLGGRFLGEYVS
ncbi:MAG: HIT domain-containing protein [Dehalococcoidia bacterium]|nr:HIT domain-containing protein [Dehalococcoidia bacterium]